MIEFHKQLIQFLEFRGWSKADSTNQLFEKFIPPNNLHLDSGSSVQVLTNSNKTDYEKYNAQVISTLSSLYNLKYEDLLDSIINNGEVFSIRIIDDETKSGDMNFTHFQEWVSNIKQVLFDSAVFTLERKPVNEGIPGEAELYIQKCRFLQTNKGSFVTRILLPYSQLLRQPGLFGDEIVASSVNDTLQSVLEFTYEKIISVSNVDVFNQDFFVDNRHIINLNLLKSLRNLFTTHIYPNSEYSFLKQREDPKTIYFNNITNSKFENLSIFIKKAESNIVEPAVPVEVHGYITNLSIKDLDYGKNVIKILTTHDRLGAMELKIKLTEELYYSAVRAHGEKKQAYFKGSIVRLKSTKREYRAVSPIENIYFA